MLKILGLIAVATAANSAVSPNLSDFAKAINSAKSLSTSYTYQSVEGVRSEYSVDLKKPNLAKLDEPGKIVVADGTTITIFDKAHNVYFKQPEDAASLKGLFNVDALRIWSGFFTPDAYQPTTSKDLGSVSRSGSSYNAVEALYGPRGDDDVTYYLDPSDKIARQAKMVEANGAQKSTYFLHTKSLTVNPEQSADLYTFTAPDGSKEVSLAEMMGAKWYTSITEAKAAAAACPAGRSSSTSFATRCGPCHVCLRTRFWIRPSSRTMLLPS